MTAAPPPADPPEGITPPEAAKPEATKPEAAKPAGEPRTPTKSFEIVDGALKLPAPVAFEVNSGKLAPAGHETLSVVADYLAAKPDVTLLRIEGHTDNGGPAAASQTLSEQRAMSVAKWLVDHGVSCKRLVPVGFGETKPIAANDTPENKAKNRRVIFINAALRGRPIGGASPDGGGKPAGDPCR